MASGKAERLRILSCQNFHLPQRRQRTHLRLHEQWLRMGKAAKVLHGREHCIPAADSTHTQLLQVPLGQDRRKSLRTKEDQPHQSLRIQVHQRASQVDKDDKHQY